MKPFNINAQQKEKKKTRQEKRKKRGERKPKVKVKTAVSLLNPKTRNFCFLRIRGSEDGEVYDL